MGIFNFFKKKKSEIISIDKHKDGTQNHYGFVSEKSAKGLSLNEAEKIQKELLSKITATSSVTDKINIGAKLLTKGTFNEAITMYSQIAQQHPEEKGLCSGQIGAAYYFLGEYHKAVSNYKIAIENGHDSMQEDNIFESAEELFNTKKDKSLLNDYLILFPKGSYAKKAMRLLK